MPARRGAVVLPGEPVATIGGGGLFLRLAIPERHAATLRVGATVRVGERGDDEVSGQRVGRVEKLYPLIEGGRVIADVVVDDLPDLFVGERVLVRVPVATRRVLAVPPDAITTARAVTMPTETRMPCSSVLPIRTPTA